MRGLQFGDERAAALQTRVQKPADRQGFTGQTREIVVRPHQRAQSLQDEHCIAAGVAVDSRRPARQIEASQIQGREQSAHAVGIGDPHCDPNGTQTDGSGNSYPTDAIPDSPPAGNFFPVEFNQLVANADPPIAG